MAFGEVPRGMFDLLADSAGEASRMRERAAAAKDAAKAKRKA